MAGSRVAASGHDVRRPGAARRLPKAPATVPAIAIVPVSMAIPIAAPVIIVADHQSRGHDHRAFIGTTAAARPAMIAAAASIGGTGRGHGGKHDAGRQRCEYDLLHVTPLEQRFSVMATLGAGEARRPPEVVPAPAAMLRTAIVQPRQSVSTWRSAGTRPLTGRGKPVQPAKAAWVSAMSWRCSVSCSASHALRSMAKKSPP